MKLDSRDLRVLNPYSPVLYAYNKEGLYLLHEPPNMSGFNVTKAIRPFSRLVTAFALVVTVIIFLLLYSTVGLGTAVGVTVLVAIAFLISILLSRFRIRVIEEDLERPLKPYVEGELKAEWGEIRGITVEEYDREYDVGKVVLEKYDGTRIEVPLVNSPYEKVEEMRRLTGA